MRLDALPAESTRELLETLLGDDPGLAPLKQLLVKRGNPFFLEETVRTLVGMKALAGERGRYRLTQAVHTIKVPPTGQAMLAARIDRMPPEDKRLLQVASVIGTDVLFALLQAIAEAPDDALRRGLDHLQAAELLDETGLFPDLEYSVRHALIHEVAYGGLLQEQRRELHARIVEAIETLLRDRLGGEIERLAHHALRGELHEKAVHYLQQAGLKAAARCALPEALASFEQALGALEGLPESRATLEQAFDIPLEMRSVLSQLTEQRRAFERVLEAQALAERLNDDHRRGLVYAFMAGDQASSAPSQALVVGTRALEIAGRLGDPRLHFVTTYYLEQAHYWRGDYEKAVELATGNLATWPADRADESFLTVTPIMVYDPNWLVHSLAQLGRFGEAITYAAEAIRLAEATRHPNVIAIAHYAAGAVHLLRGDWTKARTLLEHPIALYRAGNVVMVRRAAICSPAWVLAQLGEERESQSRLREGEQLLERYATAASSGISAGHFTRWGAPASCSVEPTRRELWASARSSALRSTSGSRPIPCICSATWRPIPTGSGDLGGGDHLPHRQGGLRVAPGRPDLGQGARDSRVDARAGRTPPRPEPIRRLRPAGPHALCRARPRVPAAPALLGRCRAR
jgi:tetratricopeptide (TPR) repeat protein